MSYSKIKYEVADNVATITLNDPATMNAAGIDVMDELIGALGKAADEARCVILTGEGRGFSSGANLGATNDNAGNGNVRGAFDAGQALDSHYHPVIMAMYEHPTPIITAVNGAAAGVGCSIALMGDLILCGESGYFLQAFRRIGLVPDGGSTYLMTRKIGRARAMEMALLGEKIPARQALDWGLVNRVYDDVDLMAEARNMAIELANGPTIALAMTRKLIWSALENGLETQLHAERISQRTAGRTSDFREGVSAFLEKRKAEFKGS